jgi:hypothetical protein
MQQFAAREKAIQLRMQAAGAAVEYSDPADLETKPPVEVIEQVWFEDSFPAGAKIETTVTPLAFVDKPVAGGKKALKVNGPAIAQTFYKEGAQSLVVPAGAGKFFVHVYLDPADPPEELMVQFNVGDWGHRAVWGADLIDWGKKGSVERFAAGELPKPGQWARLEFDGDKVGLSAGTKVAGFAFTLHGGTAYFDRMGVVGRSDPTADPALSFAAWRLAQKGRDTPGAPGDLKGWLKQGPEVERKPAELKRLRDFYVQNVCALTREPFTPMLSELAAVVKERGAYDGSVPSTFIFKDLPKPRQSFVMTRGQYDTPGEKVDPATPAILPPLKQAGARANRLDLARWLVAPENPLTARVAVNRFWQQLFGAGLVRSSHDFGTQGTLPTHPELLDWLAIWFQEHDWDMKKLVRLMVVSETFRQQSHAPAQDWVSDLGNKWLSRGPRFRLGAEQIRDQALFVGGLIELTMGGKGVNPYQPPNIWEPLAFGGSNTRYYKQGKGEDLYRRTIYTFLKRTAPHPLMENFDLPAREESCIQRDRTNTPLQALQLMNDVQHFEAARGLAVRMIAAAPTLEGRVDFGYRSVLARHAEPEEQSTVRPFFRLRLARYQAAPADAKRAITFGESPPPPDLDAAELAAWTLVANLILNLDEAIVRN